MNRFALILILLVFAFAAPSAGRVVIGPNTVNVPSGRVVFAYSLTVDRALRVRDAFASVYGYRALLVCDESAILAGDCVEGDVTFPNPVTKRQFVDLQIGRYLIAVVRNSESKAATEAAQDAEDDKPDVVID